MIVCCGLLLEPVWWQIVTLRDGVVPVTPVDVLLTVDPAPGCLLVLTTLAVANPAAPRRAAPRSAAMSCRIHCPFLACRRTRVACSKRKDADSAGIRRCASNSKRGGAGSPPRALDSALAVDDPPAF